MTRDDYIRLGFKPMPHYTVMDSLIYEIGRNRHLSAGCVGTPNEMIFICQMNDKDPNKCDDSICLHNFDYDGLMTEDRLTKLIESLVVRDVDPIRLICCVSPVSISELDIESMFPYEDIENAKPTRPEKRIRAYNSRQSDRREGAKLLLEKIISRYVGKEIEFCPDWIHKERREQNEDNFCPICGLDIRKVN